MTPSGTVTDYAVPTSSPGLRGITKGPDGNLWFTEFGGNNVGKITTSGTATEYAVPTSTSRPWGITPGHAGATLIDGHVSSWTTRGIFYGLKTLQPGDTVQIELGDKRLVTYKVVKSQVYNADQVDMAAALRPLTPNTPGLNLITCTGDVNHATSEFNQRLIVFTQQI